MPAPATCNVTGNLYNVGGAASVGAVIKAYVTQPFFLADNYIPAGLYAETVTDLNGAWTLALVRTATAGKQLTIRFEYPSGDFQKQSAAYSVTIPESASATFSSLLTSMTPYEA